MKIISTSLLLFLILSAPVFGAVDSTHVGFVDSSLWFDREPFFSGQDIRIYTMLANSSSADFSGIVLFYDGETAIGSADVTLERNGGFQVVWIDWMPEEGDHKISVKITEATLTPPGEEPETVEYENEPIYTINRFIDADTDGDGIGNKRDDDDDNDGIPDSEDSEPLIKAIEESSGVTESSVKENIEKKSTQIVVKLGEIASSTSPKIIAGIKKTINAIEEFRTSQSKNVEEKIKQVKQKIAEDQVEFEDISEEEGEGEGNKKRNKKDSPFNQLQLLALTAAGYTLSHKIAFYIAGIFILYLILKKIIPWIFGLMRRREE